MSGEAQPHHPSLCFQLEAQRFLRTALHFQFLMLQIKRKSPRPLIKQAQRKSRCFSLLHLLHLVDSDNEAASGGEDELALDAGRLQSGSLPPRGGSSSSAGGGSTAGAMYALPPQDNGGGGGGTPVAPIMRPAGGGAARTLPPQPRPQPMQYEGNVAATTPTHGSGAAMMLQPGSGTGGQKLQRMGSSSMVGQQRLVGGGGGSSMGGGGQHLHGTGGGGGAGGQHLHGGVGGGGAQPSSSAAAVTMSGGSSSAMHRKILEDALVFQMELQKKLHEQLEVRPRAGKTLLLPDGDIRHGRYRCRGNIYSILQGLWPWSTLLRYAIWNTDWTYIHCRSTNMLCLVGYSILTFPNPLLAVSASAAPQHGGARALHRASYGAGGHCPQGGLSSRRRRAVHSSHGGRRSHPRRRKSGSVPDPGPGAWRWPHW